MTERIICCSEIGINHCGDMDIAKRLIDASKFAGADYCKFQKRDPETCVPKDQWDKERDTPWGRMSYIDYRHRMEFSLDEVAELQQYARRVGIGMFWSVWDLPSLKFVSRWANDYIKLPSAMLTDHELVAEAARAVVKQPRCKGLILSTGMSTAEEIKRAMIKADGAIHESITTDRPEIPELWILHCHSAYPAPTNELNLACIGWLYEQRTVVPYRVGYSGHEFGMAPTEWAVALGAEMIERHITLDRTMWGGDQMASLEPIAFHKLVQHIRSFERALGDGQKVVHDSELPAKAKLRGT